MNSDMGSVSNPESSTGSDPNADSNMFSLGAWKKSNYDIMMTMMMMMMMMMFQCFNFVLLHDAFCACYPHSTRHRHATYGEHHTSFAVTPLATGPATDSV